MHLNGESIRVAVLTQLMVAPSNRGMAALELLRDLFHGPQDLALSDLATDTTRRLCECVGATTALLYSTSWTRPLRPWRYAAAGIGGELAQRAMRIMARPLLLAGDAAATHLAGSWFRLTAPTTQTDELSVHTMVEQWPTMSRGHALVGCYNEGFLEFVLREASRKGELGALERVAVRDSAGVPIGWYVYYVNPGDVGLVVHLAAIKGRYGDVLDSLFHHAWTRGMIAVRGRSIPTLWPLLEAKRCVLGREGPWTIVHSDRVEIVAAILRGDALLSRLDGEFWMNF
jgi:hypothetical protein